MNKKKGAHREARRPKGLGSVYPYGKGFRGYVTLGGRRVYRVGLRKRDVESALLAAHLEYEKTGRAPRIKEQGRQPLSVPDEQTFKVFATTWLERHSVRIRPSTEIEYRRLLANHVNPILGPIHLSKIRFSDFDEVIARGIRNNLARGTLGHLKTLMNQIMSAAWNDGLVTENPVGRVKLPQAPSSDVAPMPVEAIAPILEVAKRRSWSEYARRYIAMHYGLRRGEIVALKWEGLDSDALELRIEETATRDFNGEVIGETKTPKGRMRLKIGIELVDILVKVRAEQDRHRQRFEAKGGRNFNPQGLIFATRNGRQITKGSDWRAWNTTRMAAGYPHVRLHDARHMVASEAVASGKTVAAVSGFLGHADAAFTLRRYVHQSAEDAGDVGQVIAERSGRRLVVDN